MLLCWNRQFIGIPTSATTRSGIDAATAKVTALIRQVVRGNVSNFSTVRSPDATARCILQLSVQPPPAMRQPPRNLLRSEAWPLAHPAAEGRSSPQFSGRAHHHKQAGDGKSVSRDVMRMPPKPDAVRVPNIESACRQRSEEGELRILILQFGHFELIGLVLAASTGDRQVNIFQRQTFDSMTRNSRNANAGPAGLAKKRLPLLPRICPDVSQRDITQSAHTRARFPLYSRSRRPSLTKMGPDTRSITRSLTSTFSIRPPSVVMSFSPPPLSRGSRNSK